MLPITLKDLFAALVLCLPRVLCLDVSHVEEPVCATSLAIDIKLPSSAGGCPTLDKINLLNES